MAGGEEHLSAGITIRAFATRQDIEQALELQRVIWGFPDVEVLPLHMFVIASRIGGQVFGAFDGERIVGFCVSLPGLKSGERSYLHSHMLGVLAGYRDRGIGRLLKLKQREDALARGVDLLEWTFDPLEIKNAYFNIERLGAVVRRYVLNQYGTTSSPLHGGLPTDRCVAEWWLRTRRVEAVIAGEPRLRPPIEGCVEVPANIDALRRDDLPRARAIQKSISGRFLECFRRGLAVIGFDRSEHAGAYLFGRWPSE